jgi:DNA-binding response OmpR family regulator
VPSVRPVLVVEDDPSQRAALAEWLAVGGGFAVAEAASAAEAEARLAAPDAARCDAVLLDVGLPDGDGCALCLRLRRRGLAAPVIMLTGAGGEADVVRGLAAGANDYVTKPYRPAELLARLRAQLRVFDAGPDAPLAVDGYDFRPSAGLLVERATGRRVQLTEKEAALLLRLCRAGGAPVAARGGLGLPRGGGRHAHDRDPRLPAAAEDRDGPREAVAARHRRGRDVPPRPAGGLNGRRPPRRQASRRRTASSASADVTRCASAPRVSPLARTSGARRPPWPGVTTARARVARPAGESVAELPPPERPGWWRYRERRRFMPLEPPASHLMLRHCSAASCAASRSVAPRSSSGSISRPDF